MRPPFVGVQKIPYSLQRKKGEYVKTTLDKKIEKLEAELKKAKAKKTETSRQERNGQLVSLGILIERNFKTLSATEKEKLRALAETLDERNRARCLAAFGRFEES